MEKIREFKTGANRDDDTGKLDYEAALSPIVLQAYAEYIKKHRPQPDGTLRKDDNWQKGFGEGQEHFDTCMKSLSRHYMDLWLLHRGYKAREDIEDALCGVLFNTFAYLHFIKKEDL
jgi:hypothetical protein